MRRGWRGIKGGDAFRGSMAAVLAEQPNINNDRFYIDYSIDSTTIARLSFHDVLRNNFPKELVEGKKVLIGATALELGDEFAAPTRGVLPGVVLHALSYESLVQNRAINRLHFCIPLLLALGVIIWFLSRYRHWGRHAFIIRNLALFSVLLGGPFAIQAAVPVSLDVGPILAAQLFSVIYILGRRVNHYKNQILKQRAAAAHYQALTRLVVRDSADGVIVAHENGVIELCSPRAQELLGVSNPVAPGDHIHAYATGFPLHMPDEKLSAISDETLPAEESVCFDYAISDGSDRTLEILATSAGPSAANSDAEGGAHLIVYTLRDVSARKRIEAAERKAKEAALAADAVKTQLIANMSHELKTPLNGIIGFAEILKKEALGPLGASEYQDYSEMIYASGKRLSGLVNDMLTIAKLQAGEYDLDARPAPIGEIIECSIDEMELDGAKAEKTISTAIKGELSSVEIDFSTVGEMLKRLLANALEYTDDNGLIRISAKHDGDDLVLEIIDNGCGVKAEAMPKLADMFFQADASLSRRHEGAGLGLFIVSELASLHGGSLELHSKLGVGFLARLRFPGTVQEKPTKVAA